MLPGAAKRKRPRFETGGAASPLFASPMARQKENITPPKSARSSTTTPTYASSRARSSRPMGESHPKRLVLFGENERSLFLVKDDDPVRTQLVEQVKSDPLSANRWLELLKCAPSFDGAKSYLKLRLFRRAIGLMRPVEKYRESSSYAEVYVRFALEQITEAEKREKFELMKAEGIGERERVYYEEYAGFEHRLGNDKEAQDILQLGVTNGALTEPQRDDILQKWTQSALNGRSARRTLIRLSTQQQHEQQQQDQQEQQQQTQQLQQQQQQEQPQVLQTPRDQKTAFRPLTTPKDVVSVSNTAKNVLKTPTTYGITTPSTTGFSTTSKIVPRQEHTPGPRTPSIPVRTNPLKAQTTSRKGLWKPSNVIGKFGPPLRVIASTAGNLHNRSLDQIDDADEESEDTDDGMMGSAAPKPTAAVQSKPISTTRDPRQASPNTVRIRLTGAGTPNTQGQTSEPPRKKVLSEDLTYIRNWAPRETSENNASNSTAIKTEQQPQGRPSIPTSNGETGFLKHNESSGFNASAAVSAANLPDRIPSPPVVIKQEQIAAPAISNHAELSPVSVSSMSSSSSPPLINAEAKMITDRFASLTSKVVVNGQTYIKLEEIGSGGSSKVYRMLGPDLKIVALKKIKLKRLDPQSIAQYTNEIQLLKRLQGNPHIIKLIAAESDLQQRQINVIMEHGEIDLNERLRDLKDALDENFLRVIWTQMLQAVHAIHSERIIHGDLKPANFLFVNGALKLIDFGIAKAISNDTTNIERDSQVGTVNFMSPEAIQGNSAQNGQRNPGKMKVGRASDIWSLGCILYQIVYGKPPFGDVHNILEKFRCIIDPSYPIPFPSLKNKELENVIRSCLERDHRRRPTIDGEEGLLNHPFLRSGGVNAMVSATSTSVTLDLAPQILHQVADLVRAKGGEQRFAEWLEASDRVAAFLAQNQARSPQAENTRALGSRSNGAYRYNTEERRMDL